MADRNRASFDAKPAKDTRVHAPGGEPPVMRYRPDVDGLRAVAVLSVVIYHAGASWIPGGFVGVDIFFVISGYLITGIVAEEIAQGRFSIARFYVRRARRILPALFVVIAATWLLGMWLLAPSELASLGKSIAATAMFVSNVTFWREIGYFDIAAERKPLLHTWSLAVEEQFYLVWPLLLVFASRRRIDRRLLVAMMMVVSFALSVYLVLHRPDAAFYLIPARAWALLLGALLALRTIPALRSSRARNGVALSGLALIIGSVLLLDRDTLFPGWNALYPCLGTAMLIHAGEHGDHVVSRHLLARRPVVLVGLVSYSLYLWHWPLLALARITQRGELAAELAAVLVLVAGGLSVVTWRYIETPFRRARPRVPAGRTLVTYGLASVGVLAIGVVTFATDGFVRLAPSDIAATEAARWDNNPLAGRCLRWQAQSGPLPIADCTSGAADGTQTLVLWGDSHADALAPGVADLARRQGWAALQLTMASCPPLVDVRVVGQVGGTRPCVEFNNSVMRHIASSPDIGTVVLSARWTVYTEGSRFGMDDSGPVTWLVDEVDPVPTHGTSRRVFARALDRTTRALRALGKHVLIVGQVPELGINIPTCLARNSLPLAGTRSCAVLAEPVVARLSFAALTIDAVAAIHPGVCAFHPHTILCSNALCAGTASDGTILYLDDDHVSATGALAVLRRFDVDTCQWSATR